ncbi:MAG: DNA mismatch repair endonuclease MutL [Proteobacteria bacterium]|nr:DNA mismatch repair endonuclease MutL [Pseudomonadota bacterium]
MGKIIKMSELLSSKIAAGEVVERPASVVKELMENSIDSGATRISVFINEGGKRLVRVVDNGSGIEPEDMALCFERFATSKLTKIEDLETLFSMGFRGEALSSIASVARVTLTSRRRDAETASKITVEGGKIIEQTEEGAPVGTSIEVADLFSNTPARAKFLRTVGTEFARITEQFKKIALSYPECGIKLHHGSSMVIQAHPGTLAERVAEIFGTAVLDELIEIEAKSSNPKIQITGLIGVPTLTYPTGKGLMTYVNNRAIKDAGLTKAITLGYGSLLDKGRYPFALVFIKIDTVLVDVNVHPAKNEVRFSDPGGVFNALRFAINKTLGKTSSVIQGSAFVADNESEPNFTRSGSRYPATSPGVNPGGFAREGRKQWPKPNREVARERTTTTEPLEFIKSEEDTLTPEFLQMEVTGQLWGEFLLCQSFGTENDTFYMIDQHGASERARFEHLKADYYKDGIISQLLLLPERVETELSESEALKSALTELKRLGFDIEPFGPSTKKDGETFMIKSVPSIFSSTSAGRLIIELAGELAEFTQSSRIEESIEKILMTIACHSVIRGPRMLSTTEAKGLLKELSKIDFATHCPHGRPVVKRYSRAEIEALFGRT